MAVVGAANVQVFGHTTPAGFIPRSTGAGVYGCFVSCGFTGTYAQNENAIIAALATSIQNSRRDGKTVTLIDVSFAAPGIEAGYDTVGAKTVAVSTADITLELTTSDLSTEHAAQALGSFTVPLTFFVCYSAI